LTPSNQIIIGYTAITSIPILAGKTLIFDGEPCHFFGAFPFSVKGPAASAVPAVNWILTFTLGR